MDPEERAWLVIHRVRDERRLHIKRWGGGDRPDGTGDKTREYGATIARNACAHAAHRSRIGTNHENVTWRHILDEVASEALAAGDERELEKWLTRVAAVAVTWLEALDAREENGS